RSEHGLDALADPSRDSQRRRLALRSWRRAGARWDGGGSLRPLLHQFRRFRRVRSGRGKTVLAPRARSRVRLASGHRPKIRPLRRRTRGYLHDDPLPRRIRARDRARELARERILTHSDEPHTLASLASSVGMSAFHFARVFRSLIGAPPHRLLRDVRLDRARCMLLDGQSVTTTCYAVGFGNLSHFIRSFRRRFGTAPSLLRKKTQAGTSSGVA